MLYLVIVLLLVTVASTLLNLTDRKTDGATRIATLLYGGAAIYVFASYLRVLWAR